MFLYIWIKSILVVYITLFIACFSYAKNSNIVVTVPYIKDLLDNILCNSSEYKTVSIISAGIDPHAFILTPADRILLKNADIIIQIGGGLEFWLDKIKIDRTQDHLILSEHLENSNSIKGSTKSIARERFNYDPHIWQSPKTTEDITNYLSQYLISKNPKNKNKIETCTLNYVSKILTTTADLKKQISLIPEQNKVIATNHNSLGYFADYFGFKIYSILGLSDDEAPSIAQLKYLITLLQKQHIKAVFLESTGNSKNIQIVAQNVHIPVGGKLYGDSFGEKGSGADTTLGMWQTNVSTLVKALK